MKLLYLGDILGRSGRDAVCEQVPKLRQSLGLDLVVACGENAAHGFGITVKICQDLFDCGVDVITTGNHAWDQREIISFIDKEPRLLRPENCPPGTPGRGAGVFTTQSGRRVVVVQVMGRLFMDPMDCPFAAVDRVLDKVRLGNARSGGGVDAVLLDIHAEASSEKMALAFHVDGRATAVVGSHSHIPTADAMVLPKGTGYQTDAGMCGDYHSVIGMKPEAAIARFIRKMPGERLSPTQGEATLCGVVIETDDTTGLARSVHPVRIGGRLHPVAPPSSL